jgi:hypothetical protein
MGSTEGTTTYGTCSPELEADTSDEPAQLGRTTQDAPIGIPDLSPCLLYEAAEAPEGTTLDGTPGCLTGEALDATRVTEEVPEPDIVRLESCTQASSPTCRPGSTLDRSGGSGLRGVEKKPATYLGPGLFCGLAE